MDLVTTKVVAMSILGCVSLVIGFTPLKLSRIMGWSGTGRHSKRKDVVTSILLCFGGGVLLSTCMIHMLPEVRKGMKYANRGVVDTSNYEDHEKEVPYAEITLCCGFLLVYFIEELVLAIAKQGEEESSPLQRTFSMRASKFGSIRRTTDMNGNKGLSNKKSNGKTPSSDKEKSDSPKVKSARSPNKNSTTEIEGKNENSAQDHTSRDEVDSVNDNIKNENETENKDIIKPAPGGSLFDQLSPDSPSGYNPKYDGKMKRSGAESMFPNYHPAHENQKMQKSIRRNKISVGTTCTSIKGFLEQNCVCSSCTKENIDGDNDNETREVYQSCAKNCGPGRLRDFVTVLSLSFHSVFEGLAVGLETSTESVWKLFAAIATHKFVITFCIGLELVGGGNHQSISTCAYIIYMVTFILVSPFGIAIGIAISELSGIDSTNTNSITSNTQRISDTVMEVSELGQQHHIMISVLQGLAAGTILYIVVFEVLLREKSKRVPGLLQFIFIVLGFTTMLLVNLYVGHTHSGNEDDINSMNPEVLNPEIHFHPTHLHNRHGSSEDEIGNHHISNAESSFHNSSQENDLDY